MNAAGFLKQTTVVQPLLRFGRRPPQSPPSPIHAPVTKAEEEARKKDPNRKDVEIDADLRANYYYPTGGCEWIGRGYTMGWVCVCVYMVLVGSTPMLEAR